MLPLRYHDQGAVKTLWGKIAIVFGAWTGLGLVFYASLAVRHWTTGLPASLDGALRSILLDHWIWAALTPAVFFLARRFPFTRQHLARPFVAHWGFCVLASLAHVTLAQILYLPATALARFHGPMILGRFVAEFYWDIWMYWPLVGIWNVLEYERQYHERARRAAQLESQLAQAQLETLRNQLQPHFLFNPLNSISALVHDEPEGAEDMLADLSSMLRASLDANQQQEIPLAQELELLDAYLRIQRRRFEDRLRVSVEPAAGTLDALVPTLLLQPLVENAIRHGITPLARPGTLQVSARRQGYDLLVTVADDGAGLPAGYTEGIGLANTRQRLQQLYGGAQSLDIRCQGGTTVTVTLPFRPAPQGEPSSHEDSNPDRGRRTASPQADSITARG